MSSHLRRFRGLAIALAVLAISAGAVFATAPRFEPASAPTAETPASTPTPTPTPEVEDGDEDGDEADPTETPETPEAPEAPDAEDGTHGDLVSEAAQMVTPVGFANHGAFVSCVARLEGTVDLAAVTPDTCADAEIARNPVKAEKAAERAERKAQRDAAKAERAAERAAAGKGQGRP